MMPLSLSLPPPPRGWFDYGYAVLGGAQIALLRTRADIRNQNWRSRDFWRGDLRLSTFDGADERDAVEVPLVFAPKVDRFPDGCWLVTSSRAESGSPNAIVYGPAGVAENAFRIGDGINHVRCSGDGTIWVGYFDEGIYARPSPQDPSPVSGAGLVQFDRQGSVRWTYANAGRPDLTISDCYALTIDGDRIWTCFYDAFPVVRVAGGQIKAWSSARRPVVALAVEDDVALLTGDRITVAALRGGRVRPIGDIPPGRLSPDAFDFTQGRGSSLHVVSGGRWIRLTVADARAMVAAQR